MSFGGHAYDMNKTIKENRLLKKQRRARTDKVRLKIFESNSSSPSKNTRAKQYNPEYREKLHRRIQRSLRIESRNQIIAIIAVILFGGAGLIMLLKYFVF